MLIAARNGFAVGGWKNPYVTDGLVAMWDGEWNAGGGMHSDARVITNIVSGISMSIPTSGFTVGYDYIETGAGTSLVLDEVLPVSSDTDFTIETVGCCMSKPSNYLNLSGLCTLRGKGGVGMWRVGGEGASGVVIGSVQLSSDGKLHFYGAPSNNNTAMSEAYAETFGVLKTRTAIFSINSTSNILYYYNGIAKSGVSTIAYTEPGLSTDLYKVSVPTAATCVVRWSNIRVYRRIISAAEIAHNYAVDKARFNLP